MVAHHELYVRSSCSRGQPEYLHSPDCPALDEDKRRPATEEEQDELGLCPHPTCGNTAEQPSAQDMSAYNALKEAAR